MGERTGRARSQGGLRAFGATLAACALASLAPLSEPATALPAQCLRNGKTVTCTYSKSGQEQAFTVPKRIRQVRVIAVGEGGFPGHAAVSPPWDVPTQSGGAGARVAAPLAVTPGSTLYLEVGGPPGSGEEGGAAGSGTALGGAGGGASDVRSCSVGDLACPAGSSLASRLLVAGGGGGGGTVAESDCGTGGSAGGALFAPDLPVPTHGRADDVAIADLNGDSHPDLATANAFFDDVSVVLGSGAGSFGHASNYAFGDPDQAEGPISIAIADLNGDSIPDAVTANDVATSVWVLPGVGGGALGTGVGYGIGGMSQSISDALAIADLNSDSKPDLVVARGDGKIAILLGQ